MDSGNSLRMMVFSSLMAALIAIGAYLSVPIGSVPIVMQNLFVMLAGLLLGSRWATTAVAVYLLAGACGLPVFAGGSGGLGHLIGPTGGYLLGFWAAAFVIGFASERSRQKLGPEVTALIAGSLLVYAIGVPWLKVALGLSWAKALAVGMNPLFLLGDALKIAAAIGVARSIRPLIAEISLRQQTRRS